jgi:hypothetical protein
MATTLRVTERTRERVAARAQQEGLSMGEVVDSALDAYEAAAFWRQTREALAEHADALSPDPAWDRTLRDNLDHG